jgi:hypothetical protein
MEQRKIEFAPEEPLVPKPGHLDATLTIQALKGACHGVKVYASDADLEGCGRMWT